MMYNGQIHKEYLLRPWQNNRYHLLYILNAQLNHAMFAPCEGGWVLRQQ